MKVTLLFMFLNGFLISQTMKKTEKKEKIEASLQSVLEKLTDGKKIMGTSFAIKHHNYIWSGYSGNFSDEQHYFIASTTKLFVTAIILNLRNQGKLSLDDKISSYLDRSIIDGLHVYKKVDYSYQITIKQLLSHTSGIPDYFQSKGKNGRSLEEEIVSGKDQFWSFEQAIERSKQMKPLFKPETKRKAHYSDANFQILGKIIENITKKSLSENCNELIFKPLELKQTYLYQDSVDKKPMTLFYKNKEIHIPKAMSSFGPDGGMVSTSREMLVFIEAFFTGKIFPTQFIEELQEWNPIFFPLKSGVGLHKFSLPWFLNLSGKIPIFIGHSGLSGALAFHCPKENVYIVGTVNQIAYPDKSYKTMIKLVQKILKEQKSPE
jgi:D-alanyl-D-alanine carboxypeptidase